ncbi:MAG: hypothetical protein Q9160_001641 [Pyrenula sp. 1 TL-2023]
MDSSLAVEVTLSSQSSTLVAPSQSRAADTTEKLTANRKDAEIEGQFCSPSDVFESGGQHLNRFDVEAEVNAKLRKSIEARKQITFNAKASGPSEALLGSIFLEDNPSCFYKPSTLPYIGHEIDESNDPRLDTTSNSEGLDETNGGTGEPTALLTNPTTPRPAVHIFKLQNISTLSSENRKFINAKFRYLNDSAPQHITRTQSSPRCALCTNLLLAVEHLLLCPQDARHFADQRFRVCSSCRTIYSFDLEKIVNCMKDQDSHSHSIYEILDVDFPANTFWCLELDQQPIAWES